jgi:GH25 family lysozyme M1 (1,4-beta-N-acetylmuramidase)
MKLGFDVSKYQLDIPDYRTFYNCGIRFAFVKATENINVVDSRLRNHWDGLKGVNIPVGFYHLARNVSPTIQANHFYSTVMSAVGDRGNLLPVIDVEDEMTSTLVRDLVETTLTLWKINKLIIYTSKAWWLKIVGDTSWASAHYLWVANYPFNLFGLKCGEDIIGKVKDTDPKFPRMPHSWTEWDFWQFTAKANAPSFGCFDGKELDLDVLNGDDLGPYMMTTPPPPPPPPPPPTRPNVLFRGEVLVERLNVRWRPILDPVYQSTTYMKATQFDVYEEFTGAGGNTWWLTRADDKRVGWVAHIYGGNVFTKRL